jgi:hypothetical protein
MLSKSDAIAADVRKNEKIEIKLFGPSYSGSIIGPNFQSLTQKYVNLIVNCCGRKQGIAESQNEFSVLRVARSLEI